MLHQKNEKNILPKQAVGEQPDVILSSPHEITVVGDLVTTHYEGSSRNVSLFGVCGWVEVKEMMAGGVRMYPDFLREKPGKGGEGPFFKLLVMGVGDGIPPYIHTHIYIYIEITINHDLRILSCSDQ